MSDWKSCLLGDVITLKRGYDLPETQRVAGQVPVVSSAGITGYHDIAKVKAPGVVTGRYGTLGEVFYLSVDFWPHNTALYVQDFKGNNPRFIAYFLQSVGLGFRNAAGAVPGVNRNHLHLIPVRVPSVQIQEKIATILSAYDDLIDNNLRRIRLLEQAARALYLEWFVHYRFPGHHYVETTESKVGQIPSTWQLGKVSDFLELKYGKGLVSAKRIEGDVPVYGSSGIVGFHNEILVEAPGIVVGRKGNVGSVFWSQIPFFPIDTVFYVSTRISLYYVYFNLGQQKFLNSDAAVPGLNREYAHSLPFLLPTDDLIQKFDTIVAPMFENIHLLKLKSWKLEAMRDILLSRLISGELDVSNLDILVSEELPVADYGA